MSENRVNVDNTSAQPVPTITTQLPTITGTYAYVQTGLPGSAAPYTFITIWNPAGSNKLLIPGGLSVSSVATGAASTIQPLLTTRLLTQPTGGSTVADAAIFRFRSTYPATVMEVKDANPTTTFGANVAATPPPVTTGAGGGQFVHQIGSAIPTNFGGPILFPGEGIGMRVTAGDIDQFWNIAAYWAEARIS